MSMIDLSSFDDQLDEVDLYDFETFEKQLDSMLEEAQRSALGIGERDARNLREALVEDWEESPQEAWRNLSFWEGEYASYENMEWEMAA